MRTRLASQSERAGAEGAAGRVVRRDSLLKAGYLVALLLVLVPVVDAVTRTLPIRPGAETWRMGTLGIVFNAMITPLLGLFLGMVIAVALDHRRTLWAITVVTLLGALGSFVAMGGFVLDYIQLRANVTDVAMRGFDVAARKAIAVGLAGAVTTAVLGITGWRTARRISGTRRDADNVGLVIPKEEKA